MKHRNPLHPGRAAALLLGTSALLALPPLARARQEGSDDKKRAALTTEAIDDTRATLERWVETRRILSQEKLDRALGREVLQDRIRMVESEISGLRASIESAQASIAESDKKRAELLAEKELLVEASAGLVKVIGELEGRLKELLQRVPDPIRERVKPLSQLLPADPAESKVALDQRFRNVLGILNEVDKFSREITLVSEVRPLADGTSAEVTTIYLGISHGFYVNGSGTLAGVGRGTATGFEWQSVPDAAPAISAAIAILNNERVAEFVALPIRID
jgi:hypothetical protein